MDKGDKCACGAAMKEGTCSSCKAQGQVCSMCGKCSACAAAGAKK